jgi:hypothetical protein
MFRIVLTDDQTKAIAAASEPVDLVDSNGRLLGRIAPNRTGAEELSPAEFSAIKEQMAAALQGAITFSSWQGIKGRLQAQGNA